MSTLRHDTSCTSANTLSVARLWSANTIVLLEAPVDHGAAVRARCSSPRASRVPPAAR